MKLIQIIVLPILLFFGLKYGSRAIPINANIVHFSDLEINNVIATNNIWYLGNSICSRKATLIDNTLKDEQ